MKGFSELEDILELAQAKDSLVQSKTLTTIKHNGEEYPIISFSIGAQRKDVPTFGIFAGVHGLEKVGTHLATTKLSNLFYRLSWDQELRKEFEKFRIVSIPLINPVGMHLYKRSNPNGVDLMRNSPTIAESESFPLLAGHRISPKIPWYRGEENKEMEIEAKTLVNFVQEEMFQAPFSMAIDLHSGFGMKDRLWYPYAKTKSDFPHKPEIQNLVKMLDQTLPHHVYQIEQQSESYTANGDLWDYIFDLNHENKDKKGIFIPWTLELGSWLWVKKNPIQAITSLGLFNPIKKHRYDRVMRRHLTLFDFLIQATKNSDHWKV